MLNAPGGERGLTHEQNGKIQLERLVFLCPDRSFNNLVHLYAAQREGIPMIDNKILNIISWIFLVIFIIFALWYMLGNSPVEFSLFLPVITILGVKFWTMSNDIAYLKGDYNQFKDNIKDSFQKVKDDLTEIKGNITEINRKRKK